MHDVAVIGLGAGGEAAALLGAGLGADVVAIERQLVGGECPFWACMPSKTLLDAAKQRHDGRDYPWERASDRRDWMISREGIPFPDDSGHVHALETAGARFLRGSATVAGPGRVEVRLEDGGTETVETRAILVAAGAVPVIPPIDGLTEAGFWTSQDATSTRELPSSLVVLGGGPVGVELAQAFARFGTRVTVVESSDRILARDHPKSSETVAASLEADGIDIRTGVRAERAERGGAGRRVHLSDGSVVDGAEVLVATGRRPADLRELGLESAGVVLDEHGAAAPDDTLRIGDGVWVAGDAAGGLQFTHVADYEGRVAMRAALGRKARADLSSIPRTTFTDPETGAVGLTVEEAREQGIDAFEKSQDFDKTSRGFTIEGSSGHLTAVVDRDKGVLCGVFAAGPAASELIGEAVLAIKQRIPLTVLTDTIRAFPTGTRALGGVFGEAADELGAAE